MFGSHGFWGRFGRDLFAVAFVALLGYTLAEVWRPGLVTGTVNLVFATLLVTWFGVRTASAPAGGDPGRSETIAVVLAAVGTGAILAVATSGPGVGRLALGVLGSLLVLCLVAAFSEPR